MGWDEAALEVEAVTTQLPMESQYQWRSTSEAVAEPRVPGYAMSSLEEEASVGQWLSNIAQGAATGAATGLAAGPWGALVGGLVGGGLGAVQTATAPPPRPAAPPPPPAPRPAPRPPAVTPRATPIASRPVAPTGQIPTSVPQGLASGSGSQTTATQLVDQLATLVPVVAALAVQIGQLTQQAQPAAPLAVNVLPESEIAAESPEPTLADESAEDAFEESSWHESPSGEWMAASDRSNNVAED
jgi:hypothetical protein